MSNPLYNALGGGRSNNMMAQFRQFMRQMQGKNPHEEISKLLQSGKISQEQLNIAQQKVQEMQQMMGFFKK